MNPTDLVVGQKYQHALFGVVTVAIAEADCNGWVVAQSDERYFLVNPCNLTTILKRYIVELRLPKTGEQYLAYGDVITPDKNLTIPRPVIVGGVDQ